MDNHELRSLQKNRRFHVATVDGNDEALAGSRNTLQDETQTPGGSQRIEKTKSQVEEESINATELADLSLIKTLLEALPDQQGTDSSYDKSRQILIKVLESKISWGSIDQSSSLLCLAASKGVLEAVEKIIREATNVDPNADGNGTHETPLMLASKNGHAGVVNYLLTIDAVSRKRDYQDDSGHSAISYAAKNGHTAIVEYLLGPEVGTRAYHLALVEAAEQGHLDTVAALTAESLTTESCLAQGDIDDEENRHVISPLDDALLKAIDGRYVDVVSLFLSRGADPNARDDENFTTTLDLAVNGSSRELELCKALLKDNKITPATLNATNDFGRTPLSTAALYRLQDVVDLLLDYNADTEAGDCGKKPIEEAYDSPHITESLIVHKANVETVDGRGWTPLARAVAWRREDTANVLLDYNANILAADNNGRTPFHHGARCASPELFSRLLQLVPIGEVNRTDEEGRGALFWVRDPENVKKLLSRDDIDINQIDNNGHFPLEIAIKDKNVEKARMLFESPKLTLQVASSKTAIELLEHGLPFHDEVVSKRLLEADFHKLCDLDTLRSIAIHSENLNLIEYVLEETKEGEEVIDENGWPLAYIRFVYLPTERRGCFSRLSEEFIHALEPPSSWRSARARLGVVSDDGMELMTSSVSMRLYNRWYGHHPSIYDRNVETATARTDYPIPPMGIFSIEMEVLDMNDETYIVLGFGRSLEENNILPGTGRHSWGYHATTGECYALGKQIAKSRSIKKGDVVRCRIDTVASTARFKINEDDLDFTIEGIIGRLYPMIGVRANVKVRTRFDWSEQQSV